MLGVSGAYARQLALGNRPITPLIAEAWLIATHRKPKTIQAVPCPTCGIVHGEGLDCGGAEGDVVWVKPGQRVVKQGKPRSRPRYWRPCLPVTLTDDQRRRILEIASE